MANPRIETVESLTWDGPVSLTWGIGLAVLLLAVCGWSFWRERMAASRPLSLIFILLRSVAIVMVLVMLAGPARETIVRRIRAKTVLVALDASGSMDTVDERDGATDPHWDAAVSATTDYQRQAETDLLSSADRAAFFIATAQHHAEKASAALENGNAGPRLGAALKTAQLATEQAVERLSLVQMTRVHTLADEAGRIKTSIADSVLPILKQLQASTSVPDPKNGSDVARKARQASAELSGIVSSTRHLSDQLARGLGELPAATTQNKLPFLSRREKATHLLEQAEKTWGKGAPDQVTLRRYQFDDRAFEIRGSNWSGRRPKPATAPTSATEKDGRFTNLTALLEEMARVGGKEAVAGAILISDGRHNDAAARDPRAVARTLGNLPVFAVPIGSTAFRRDVLVHHVQAPTTVLHEDMIAIQAIVTAYRCAGENCVVELVRNGRPIDKQTFKIETEREDHPVTFRVKADETGLQPFVVRIAAISGEAEAGNNLAPFSVSVVDRTLKLLLVDSFPRWEFRYLMMLFNRDETIQFDHLLFHPEPEGSSVLRSTLQLPDSADAWARYNVVILGDVSPVELNEKAQRSLAEFVVQRGGSLIIVAGDDHMPKSFVQGPLGPLIPVETAGEIANPSVGLHLKLTSEGLTNVAMDLGDVPGETSRIWEETTQRMPLYSLSDYCRPKPACRTLIEAVPENQSADPANRKSFLCWQTVGRGRVVYISAPETYHLRMRNGDRYHHRLWGQLLRWSKARDLAAGSKTVQLATDKIQYQAGEEVPVFANLHQMNGEPVTGARVRVTALRGGESAGTTELRADDQEPGRYVGRFETLPPGGYKIRVEGGSVTELLASEKVSGPVETDVAVEADTSTEMREARCDLPLMKEISEVTGGRLVPPAALVDVMSLLDLSPRTNEEIRRQPLWDRWFFLWIVIGCLTTEWALRKWRGLA